MSEMDLILKQTKVDFRNRSPADFLKRLPYLFDTAKLNMADPEAKCAFIFLKRWMNIVEWIKKHKDYRNKPALLAKLIPNAQVEEVKSMLELLEKKLIAQYAPDDKKVKNNNSPDTTTKEVSGPEKGKSAEGALNLPETPTDDPLSSESDDFLSCLQLFQSMQRSKLLIIDVRSENDYLASRIKSDLCINIPGDKIKPGVIAAHFEKLLSSNKEALYRFSRRSAHHVDTIVILDWRTTHATLFPNNEIRTLKDILQRWDPGTQCSKIKILEGGYAEWLNRYPAYVTNSNVKAPDIDSDAMDEILEGVKYPDWLNSDDPNSPFNAPTIKSLSAKNTKSNNFETKNSILSTKKSTVGKEHLFSNENDEIEDYSYDRPNVEKSTSESAKIGRKIDDRDSDGFNAYVVPKPTVDRSSKPTSLMNNYVDSTDMLSLMRQNYEFAKVENDLKNKRLDIEMAWQYNGADEDYDKRSTSGHLETIKTQLDEVRTKRAALKAALAKEKVEESLMSPKDVKEKHALDLRIGTEEQRLMQISIERKKLHESIREQDKKRNQVTSRLTENGIHREPLKSDGPSSNSGMKRSYSTPNLAQLDDQKVPHVDRSSKPNAPVPQVSNRARPNTRISQYRLKDREDRMEPVYRNGHPGITGLKNLGNSCYMNSIIQCLSNTAYLAKYFNDNMHIDHLNTSNDNGTQSLVADEVAHVIKALWRGQYKSISPRDLKVVIGQYKLQFDTTEQQDSHEFLTFLLDWMHNDLKRELKMRVDGPLSPAEKEWDKAMENRRSIISDLFFGQLRSSIICATCGNSSITYETFNSLTMSLPHTNRCTLDDCVKKYVSGQKVSGWKCPNCKVPREATKKFDFMKLAPVVVIHLNRFAETDGWLEKKNTSVDFPLVDFNLKPYLVPHHESANNINQFNHNYSLYAVSNHYGTMDGGHYTAYCKSATQNKWYKYDDQTVSEVERSTVKSQTASAYLLFYTSFSSEQFAYR